MMTVAQSVVMQILTSSASLATMERSRSSSACSAARSFALACAGEVDAAEALIHRDGQWLEVPDIQEGEISLSELWYVIQEKLAARQGRAFDRADARPPRELDFRMFVE